MSNILPKRLEEVINKAKIFNSYEKYGYAVHFEEWKDVTTLLILKNNQQVYTATKNNQTGDIISRYAHTINNPLVKKLNDYFNVTTSNF